jgi:hypothetical protein
MRLHRLQDRIARGLGTAARHAGAEYDAYRPADVQTPLAPENRYLRLPAAFADENLSFRRPVQYGRATWSGIFDTAYTRTGDYLAGPAGVFFIAAQQSLLPPICILTSATITLSRPAAPSAAGVNSDGGLTAATATPVLTGWPASVLFAGSGSPGELPGDASTPTWTILLPNTPATISSADVITDNAGRSYVVGSAELTALGWRILAKQATN